MSGILPQQIEELRLTGVKLLGLLNDIDLQAEAMSAQADDSDLALANAARKLLKQRSRRQKYLPPELFAEPAWDMLLDLFIAQMEGREVSVTSVCLASSSPPTTALRWLEVVQGLGLVERSPSAEDRRVSHVRLTSAGSNALRRYLADLRQDRPRPAPHPWQGPRSVPVKAVEAEWRLAG